MNYIKQLNAVFERFDEDQRLNPTHISLYMALFRYWNLNRFPKQFYVNRQEIMCLSKIGSRATYQRCLKYLDKLRYIEYLPSHNPYKGSQIKMLIFEPSSVAGTGLSDEIVVEQALVPYTNDNKRIQNKDKPKLPKSEKEVLKFFEKKGWPILEGKKFFNHYNTIGWKIRGKIKIVCWHSAAENWMLKAKELDLRNNPKGNFHDSNRSNGTSSDNLKVTKNKDYAQPL